jgi:hypothetical protein
MPARNLVTSPSFANVLSARISDLVGRGKSAIKRAAIVPYSRFADARSGSAAIEEANLSMAVSCGSPASSAASCQGSIPNRDSAESTLSGVSFWSLPIRENRKLSNSDPRLEIDSEWVISNTRLRYLYRTHRTTFCCSQNLTIHFLIILHDNSGLVTGGGCLTVAVHSSFDSA